MSIPNYQERKLRERATVETSPTGAYVSWLYEELGSGRWNSDPTQPCLLYKVYHNVESIALDARPPLRLGSSQEALLHDAPVALQATPDQLLAWILYYTHALTRFIRPAPGSLPTFPTATSTGVSSFPATITGPLPHAHPVLSRPVPSGGSLHPVEIYLALGTQWHIPAGIYHYDSLHHALDLLRGGDYREELAALLPAGNDVLSCSAVLLPAVFFQKNHQKYTNISYRLQTLDTGIVIEQLRFMAHRFGLQESLYLQYVDRPLHYLIGLDMREECVYAALSLQCPIFHADTHCALDTSQASHTIFDLPPVNARHMQPFKPLQRSALFESLHASSLLETLPERPEDTGIDSTEEVDDTDAWFPLPAASFTTGDVDVASVLLHRRRTSFNAIDTRPLSTVELGTVLHYARGVRSEVWRTCNCRIYCIISRVNGLPAGVYRYSLEHHALVQVHAPDLFSLLIRLSTAPYINPHLAPVNIFFTGDYVEAHKHYSERGFRMMGMEIGRSIQRISLAAAAHTLAVHTHLSYKFEIAEAKLLCLSANTQIPLASLMLGHRRYAQDGFLETIWF